MTDRRTLLALLGAGVLPARLTQAQHQMNAARVAPEGYKIQFFTPIEYRVLDRLTEMILPASERSPSASGARVPDFIDLIVANSAPEAQNQWRSGIEAFGGAAFLKMTANEQVAALDRAASDENAPVSPAGDFFIELKAMTLRGYYTSEIGLRRELGYLGPEVLSSFPGCKA
jgi:hypothetical protein